MIAQMLVSSVHWRASFPAMPLFMRAVLVLLAGETVAAGQELISSTELATRKQESGSYDEMWP